MKERPILFSGLMVRAILAGKKTQTRRVVKPQPEAVNGREPTDPFNHFQSSHWGWASGRVYHADNVRRCPYGQPGDLLWVRETFAPSPDGVIYRATKEEHGTAEPGGEERWKPSIFMRRHESRLTLRVTSVRVERLQDISEDDAKAEGAAWRLAEGGDLAGAFDGCGPIGYRNHFRDIWHKINGEESWDSNPWVWVVSFGRVERKAEAA